MKVKTRKYGAVELGPLLNPGGGEGSVYTTDQPGMLCKVYDPRERPKDLAGAQVEKLERYLALTELPASQAEELQCLPRDAFRLADGRPAYLMQLARGSELDTSKTSKVHSLPILARLQMAQSVALALQKLHTLMVVHADVKPANYFCAGGQTGYVTRILDLDSAGYNGAPLSGKRKKMLPSAVPDPFYRAPELFQSATWESLWKTDRFFEPDRWALAVLLYQLIVDPMGPFPRQSSHKLPAGSRPYERYERTSILDSHTSWPKAWQSDLMKHKEVPVNIIDSFAAVFGRDRDVLKSGKGRLTAADWSARLGKAVQALQTPSVLPSGAQVHSTKSGTPPSSPATTPSAAGLFPPVVVTPRLATPAPKVTATKSAPTVMQAAQSSTNTQKGSFPPVVTRARLAVPTQKTRHSAPAAFALKAAPNALVDRQLQSRVFLSLTAAAAVIVFILAQLAR